MKLKLSSSLLLAALSFMTAKAQDFQQPFPARPYWYNPGAVSHDTNHVISGQTNFIIYTSSFFRDRSRFIDAQFAGEISLPKKMGAIGLQYHTRPGGIFDKNRTYSLAYAYGIPLAGGRLGIGAQANFNNNQVPEEGIPWENRLTFRSGVTKYSDYSKTIFDFSAGAYYNRGKFFAGISGQDLLGSKTTFVPDSGNLRLTAINYRHIRATGGYLFGITSELQLQTSAMLDYTSFPGRGQLETQVNATAIYKSHWQAGITLFQIRDYSMTWFNLGYQSRRFDIFASTLLFSDRGGDPLIIRAGAMFKLPGLGKN